MRSIYKKMEKFTTLGRYGCYIYVDIYLDYMETVLHVSSDITERVGAYRWGVIIDLITNPLMENRPKNMSLRVGG